MYFIHIPKTAGTSISMSLVDNGIMSQCTGKYPMHNTIQEIYDIDFTKPIVTCIRNPYDRFYSLYNYLIKYRVNPAISFEEFARVYKEHYHGTIYTFNTQLHYITIDGSIAVSDILRFEHLEKDWNTFCSKYNLNCKLGHYRLVHKDIPVFTREINAVIEDVFADDIKLWNSL